MRTVDFPAARDQLAKARAAAAAARDALARAVEAQRAIEAERHLLARRLDARDPAALVESARLEDAARVAASTVKGAADQVTQTAGAAAAAQQAFEVFTDPRTNVGQLSDRSPFVLLPVRVETRFVTVLAGAGTKSQLWVRVYPDDCWIDTFEPDLSATELANAKRYWQAVWAAGGEEGALRAAWRRLVTAHGPGRAGWIVDTYRPVNLPAPPQVPDPSVAMVLPADPPTRQSSWSRAPRVEQFPDRFVVLGYAGGALTLQALGGPITLPLYVGPDPSADPSVGIHADGADLFVPDQLRWMVDFQAAVAAGMGLAIDLTAQQAAAGFDRLLVVGLQLGLTETAGSAALRDLLRHHQAGTGGLALVAQGTPAHGVTGGETGYSRVDDPDHSFDERRRAPLYVPTSDTLRRRDGEWVAWALGLAPDALASVSGADGLDQARARAIHRALWPATLGYWLDKMLYPMFDDATIEATHSFFTQFVSGRGAAPALRVGRQPYGILPTTAFSRIKWMTTGSTVPDPQLAYLARLLPLLRKIDADWTALGKGVSRVGGTGDPHQALLDIVGLHPTSVEYHSRWSESLDELFNIVNLGGMGDAFWKALGALALQAAGANLLTKLGWSGAQPEILRHVFLDQQQLIANVVDDRPLSETEALRVCTDDKRNYLAWLRDSAASSLDTLRTEQGFTDGVTPATVLYLYLRHALLMGYYDASYALHRTAGFLTAVQLAAMKPEPVFVHVTGAGVPSESRFAALYKTQPQITGSPTRLVGDHITANLAALVETRGLLDQVDALGLLVDAPTAQLERAFAEHIDTCTYRLDAWFLGIVSFQLQRMRGRQEQPGSYLGAYAWLEDLRPRASQLTPAKVPADLQQAFAGPTPLLSDPANGGYVHAPSLGHARTAAILRSGYLANATKANPGTMAVNLSSDRVRLALSLLEGIRNGQSLGALLGYRFERGLHDDHALDEVDRFIHPLRKAFPLAADGLATTKTGPGVPIEAVEASNVLDGRKLVAHVRDSGVQGYPFGLVTLPAPGPADGAAVQAIDAQVDAMLDLHDAIADLALAEGVHQAQQGNFERIAATLDAYSTGHFPPEPEVVQTPPSGIGLTHRVALQLRSGLDPGPDATPRALAEPALDAWLEEVLPQLVRVGCVVTWTDPANGAPRRQDVTLADLGVRPIDVLSLVKPDDVQAMTELDDRVAGFVAAAAHPRPDATLEIAYLTAPDQSDALSVFEVTPLVAALRALVARSRPLRATDVVLHDEAAPEQDAPVFVDRDRVASPVKALEELVADMDGFLAGLSPLVADPVAGRQAIVDGIDGSLDAAAALLERGARLGLPQSGWGFAHDWRRTAYADLVALVRDLVERWTQRLADFDVRLAAYDALPAGTGDAHRLRDLLAAERLVATAPDNVPPGPLRVLLDTRRAEFVAHRDQFAAFLGTTEPSFANALAAVALLPTAAFDADGLDLVPFGDRAVTFAEDLVSTMAGHRATAGARLAAVQEQLEAHDNATSDATRAEALQAGARALLGEEFRLIPEFTVDPARAKEWANAIDASTSGKLLDHLLNAERIDDPVGEWLFGLARVRPQLHEWEAATMLSGVLGGKEPALLPVQLPHEDGASWAAMQLPADAVLDADRLLYTAHYAAPFDGTARQCGLLLDEWTEVVPASTRETGITLHFDRPDSEPPQSILVVTPASASGTWQWDDLVGALDETLDLAHKRAVEPAHIDPTAYSRFVPATIAASALYAISITTILTAANHVLDYVKVDPHD